MQVKQFLTLAVVSTAFTLAGMASGQTVTWQGGVSADWSTPGNWDTGNVPGSSNDVIIPDVTTDPEIDTAVNDVASLEVQNGGRLEVLTDGDLTVLGDVDLQADSGGTFGRIEVDGQLKIEGSLTVAATVDGSSNRVPAELVVNGELQFTGNLATHPVGGDIVLSASNSQIAIDDDMTFEPYNDGGTDRYGFIIGDNRSSEIVVAVNNTLTNAITIEGTMQIRHNGGMDCAGFHNASTGVVLANVGSATLELAPNLDVSDDAGALWKADGSTLLFELCGSWTSAAGDFAADGCGVLDIRNDIATTGDLIEDGDAVVDTGGLSVTFDAANISTVFGCQDNWGTDCAYCP